MVPEPQGPDKGGDMQNFKSMPRGVYGSNGEVSSVGFKPSRMGRGKVGLSGARNGSMPNLAVVKRVPRTQPVPGTVVWAHVPYEKGHGEKARPAVVVKLSGRDLTILPGTTSERRWELTDKYVEVRDRTATGLTRPTGIRNTSVTVDLIEVMSVVSRLGEVDTRSILGHNAIGRRFRSAGPQVPEYSNSSFASIVTTSGDAA
jgi:hypothetical protein